MTTLRKIGAAIVAAAKWAEREKVAIFALLTAVYGVYAGLRHGADFDTISALAFAVVLAVTRFTVTPLSKPQTSAGVPLVPLDPGPQGKHAAPGGN